MLARTAVVVDGGLEVAQTVLRAREVVHDLAIVRRDVERVLVRRARLQRLVQRVVQVPEQHQHVGALRLELEAPVAVLHRRVVVAYKGFQRSKHAQPGREG